MPMISFLLIFLYFFSFFLFSFFLIFLIYFLSYKPKFIKSGLSCSQDAKGRAQCCRYINSNHYGYLVFDCKKRTCTTEDLPCHHSRQKDKTCSCNVCKSRPER